MRMTHLTILQCSVWLFWIMIGLAGAAGTVCGPKRQGRGPTPGKAQSIPPKGYVCYRHRSRSRSTAGSTRELEDRPVDRPVRRHRGGRSPPPAVPDAGQDALGRHLFLRRRTCSKNRTSGARSPSTTRSSSRITTSRSSSTPTAITTSITRSRSMRSIPNGTCSSRRHIAMAGRRSTSGRSRA